MQNEMKKAPSIKLVTKKLGESENNEITAQACPPGVCGPCGPGCNPNCAPVCQPVHCNPNWR